MAGHKEYSLQFNKQKCLTEHLLTTCYIQALCFTYSMSFNPYNHHIQCALVSSPWGESWSFIRNFSKDTRLLRDWSNLQIQNLKDENLNVVELQSLGTLCTLRPLLTGRGGGLPLLLLPTGTSRRSGSEDHRESLHERRESMPTREGRLLAGRSQSPGDNAQGVCGGVIPNPSPGGVWRHPETVSVATTEGVLLASSGQRPKMLLPILRCTNCPPLPNKVFSNPKYH